MTKGREKSDGLHSTGKPSKDGLNPGEQGGGMAATASKGTGQPELFPETADSPKVRYADDCNIYVRSERAGKRVMASITRFIEKRLRLKVNRDKSAVAKPEGRHFLGFRLRRVPIDGRIEVMLSKRSEDRINEKIKAKTPRNWGQSLRSCIKGLNLYLTGWINFFRICTAAEERTLRNLDAHIRRRLRAILLRQWKRRRTIVRRLIRLGIKPKTAWRSIYNGRKALWALSHNPAVDRALRNAYFAARGLVSIEQRWRELAESV